MGVEYLNRFDSKIREGEGQYLSFFNHFQGIAFETDLNLNILFLYGAIEEITGYNKKDIVAGNPKWQHIVHPDDLHLLYKFEEKAKPIQNALMEHDYRIIRKDGQIRWLHENIQCVYNEFGKPFKIQGELYDITDRKQAEEALRKSEQKFRYIFNHSNDSIIIHDLDGNILEVNQVACELMGYSRDEMLQISLMDLDASDYKINMSKLIKKQLQNGHAIFERNCICKDGSIFPVEISNRIIEYGGKPAVLSIVRDITERKIAEESVKASEKKFRTIFNNANDAIYVTDLDGHFLEINQVACEQIGYSRDELLQMTPMDIDAFDSTAQVGGRINQILQNGHAIFETVHIRKDGSTLPVETSVRIAGDDEKPVLLGICRDITERKQAEEELQKYAEDLSKANEELKSLDKIKDEFLSNVSHELKTPLVSIMGYNELLYDETLGSLNEQQKKALETIARNSKRLRSLVDSLLYISLVQAGKIEYAFEAVQIEEVVNQVVMDLILLAEKKSLKIKKDIPDNLPLIDGDKDKLIEVLINLIENAIKFTPPSGNITIAANAEENNLHIIVKDTGIGIPENMISNLFQRFYQIDGSTTRKHGGTGLGLNICKNIVKAHNGNIWAESQEGVGTTMHVELPYSKS